MQRDDLKKSLSTTPLKEFLVDAAELDLLLQHSIEVIFLPGEVILQQGKKSIGMYIIIEGTALATAKILGEGGTYIATLHHGSLIGEMSLIEKGPSTISVIASSKVKCLLISNNFFDMLALFFPDTKFKLTQTIAIEVCNRLKEVHRKITSYMMHSDMVSRSVFGEVIKSLTRPTNARPEEVELDTADLQKTEFFKQFTDNEYQELLQQSVLIKAPKHCTLIQDQDSNLHCYILLRGAVQSSIVEGNKVAKLSVLGPISLFSSVTCVDQTPSVVRYTACERALLLKLTDAPLMQNQNTQLWYKLFNIICKSLIVLERAADKLDIRLNSELYNR